MADIKINDVVKLNSGGPEMTVFRYISQEHSSSEIIKEDVTLLNKGFNKGDVICKWFEGVNLKSEPFRIGSLYKMK